MVESHGFPLKKKFGQHFLRVQQVADDAVNAVHLDETSSVFEIGGGDGFLTKSILKKSISRLWIFEIDPHWVTVLRRIDDPRLNVFEDNFLDIDFSRFDKYKPWTLLANLPYQVTFPILYRLQQHRALLKEGVVMIQEEVAQKIVRKGGRGYGYPSLFLQHYFDWKLLQKVSPAAFFPPPKVHSRLIYFRPKAHVPEIPHEEAFWKFIKFCFLQPRRTLKNNLAHTHYDITRIPEATLLLRAQQMSMDDLLHVWNLLN